MRNQVEPENFLKLYLTPFILSNIVASMAKDLEISLHFRPEPRL